MVSYRGWSLEERTNAINLYAEGMAISEIAKAIGKGYTPTYYFFQKYNTPGENEKYAEMQTMESEKMQCHTDGFTDKESAALCGIPYQNYREWRESRGLPCNYELTNVEKKKKMGQEKRVVLTADDLIHYNHNDNSKIRNSEKIILSVQISEPKEEEVLLAPVTNLADRIKARSQAQAKERQKYTAREEPNNLAYVARRSASPCGRFV